MNRLAVFGNPVSHSRSPEIHTLFGQQANIALTYEKRFAERDGFALAVAKFVSEGATGFNVTVPFKHEAMLLADELSPSARLSEAVNTISVGEDGRLIGDNTDGIGLITDMGTNLGWQLAGRTVLIIGAGGAVQGVLPALLEQRPDRVHILNRTPERARTLASHFDVQAVTQETAADHYDVVISGSSAGLSAEDVALPARLIGPRTHCYDLIYAAKPTPFLRWARLAGCAEDSDGLGMLVEQAAAAFQIWFGFLPETKSVIARMRINIRGS